MDIDLKALWQRERARREALWALELLRPGLEEAIPLLTVLNDIDQQDQNCPISEARSLTIDQLRELVPETTLQGSDGYPFVIVLDQHIPQPWRMRFEAASAGSTRLHEGSYASDWRRSLRLWVREMAHLGAHRKGELHDRT
ncbi:hypothetical protein [Pseudomonas sp.]|uniref:hypothetical protein n=1 Tax=Pseudomonas sp. TaxID=306 RepID=UPI002E315EAA|nr:hypothetical protein [Pseudomonas sp.]HEX4550438.1 hypothetical protein [Pseudomonas sp.]